MANKWYMTTITQEVQTSYWVQAADSSEAMKKTKHGESIQAYDKHVTEVRRDYDGPLTMEQIGDQLVQDTKRHNDLYGK